MSQMERRRPDPKRSAELRKMLTLEQQVAMYTLGSFGWWIWFVRKPLFDKPQVVLANGDNVAMLSPSGDLIERPCLTLRASAPPQKASVS